MKKVYKGLIVGTFLLFSLFAICIICKEHSESKQMVSGDISETEDITHNNEETTDENDKNEETTEDSSDKGNVIGGENYVKTQFVHVEGKDLVDEKGNLYRIKGMNFGNNVWQNPKTPTLTHHDKDSYKELQELGFNTVRFYLNYRLFEDDANPYVYKEEAFEWLDQNIEWAKEHNIKLILNMHVPQGGFISASSVSFWDNEENSERYMALWKEIARRYAKEPVILGYGLMNEPFVPKLKTTEESLELYYELIEELVAKIREVDDNHVIFVERPYGIVSADKTVNYAWGDTGSFRRISDSNTVYEFHFYEYTNFTGQEALGKKFERPWYYGDDSIALMSGKRDYSDICRTNSLKEYDSKCGGWQYMESVLYNTEEFKDANVSYVMLNFEDLQKEATLYIDDIVVKEYDSDGKWIRDVYKYSFDDVTACSGWDFGMGTGGKCTYVQNIGHDAQGCEMLTQIGGSYRIYKNESLYNYFPIKKGHKYQVTFWLRMENGQNISVQPGLQLINVEKVYALDEEFLKNKLSVYIELGEKYGVPIYIGEFGTTSHIMGNKYGGEKWVQDVLDILNKNKMHYSYHDYHEENYGLYTTPSTVARTDRNEVLYHIFKNSVKD